MTNTKPLLNKDLHLRLDENFQNQLVQIAQENNLKPSTFARIVLQRNVPHTPVIDSSVESMTEMIHSNSPSSIGIPLIMVFQSFSILDKVSL